MNPGSAFECSRSSVAGAAIQISRQVSRVGLGIFADCSVAIMAGLTVVGNAAMIEHCAGEAKWCTGIVTDTAVLIGCYMVARFAFGELAVMTGLTVIHDANMIESCW